MNLKCFDTCFDNDFFQVKEMVPVTQKKKQNIYLGQENHTFNKRMYFPQQQVVLILRDSHMRSSAGIHSLIS